MRKKTMESDNLVLKKQSIRQRIYDSVFAKELYQKKSFIFKMTAAAMFLAIAVGLSLLEIFDIPMPWGASFGIRFFDTLVIIYSISIVGIGFALLEGLALPWIHNAIDGHHTWIEMGFFAISDTIVIFVFWFVYYILFNAAYKIKVPENVDNHDIHEYHFKIKQEVHIHHHKIINIEWTKKIVAFVIIIPIAALTEAFSSLIVARILLAVGGQGSGPEDVSGIFDSAKNVVIYICIFGGIFIAKYIIVAAIFLLLENRTRALLDRYGIYS